MLTVPEFPINCFSEFTATANREDLTVRGKSAECLMEHCRFAALDFWVLTYTFRPTRKTLFVYVRITEAFALVCTILPMFMGLTKFEVKKFILLTKHEGRTGRISARGLDSTDLAQRGPYKKNQGTIFSQDGLEQAWLIRDLLHD